MNINWDELARNADGQPVMVMREFMGIADRHTEQVRTFVGLVMFTDGDYRYSFKGNLHEAIGALEAFKAALVADAVRLMEE